MQWCHAGFGCKYRMHTRAARHERRRTALPGHDCLDPHGPHPPTLLLLAVAACGKESRHGSHSLHSRRDHHDQQHSAPWLLPQVPGYLLLRDGAHGDMFALPPDESDGIVQYDLADDVVVAQLFSSTAWQDVMQPIMLRDAGGRQQQLQLSAGQFREAFSLLEGAEEELDAIPEQQGDASSALQPAQ